MNCIKYKELLKHHSYIRRARQYYFVGPGIGILRGSDARKHASSTKYSEDLVTSNTPYNQNIHWQTVHIPKVLIVI